MILEAVQRDGRALHYATSRRGFLCWGCFKVFCYIFLMCFFFFNVPFCYSIDCFFFFFLMFFVILLWSLKHVDWVIFLLFLQWVWNVIWLIFPYKPSLGWFGFFFPGVTANPRFPSYSLGETLSERAEDLRQYAKGHPIDGYNLQQWLLILLFRERPQTGFPSFYVVLACFWWFLPSYVVSLNVLCFCAIQYYLLPLTFRVWTLIRSDNSFPSLSLLV